MNRYILLFIGVILIDACLKKLDVLDLYIEGVKNTISIVLPLFSTMLSFMLFVQCLKASGFITYLEYLLMPICQILKIPIDIIILGVLRPISANASLSYLYDFYLSYGVDHVLSLLGTLIQCGSDTTLYVISLYFSSVKMNNTRYAIWLGLLLDFLAVIISVIIYLKMFA